MKSNILNVICLLLLFQTACNNELKQPKNEADYSPLAENTLAETQNKLLFYQEAAKNLNLFFSNNHFTQSYLIHHIDDINLDSDSLKLLNTTKKNLLAGIATKRATAIEPLENQAIILVNRIDSILKLKYIPSNDGQNITQRSTKMHQQVFLLIDEVVLFNQQLNSALKTHREKSGDGSLNTPTRF